MKRFTLLFAFLLWYCSSFCAGGEPPIQAVCRITLNNGSIIEGFISLGNEFNDFYKTDAICIVKDDSIYYSRKLDLFFRLLDIEAEINTSMKCKGKCKIYFAKAFRTDVDISSNYKQDSGNYISQTYSNKTNYHLLNEFPVHKELPLSLYLGYGDDTPTTDVIVADIRTIEILPDPPKVWLDKIKSTNQKRLNSKEPWEDYISPVWYHEIVKDNAALDSYSSLFKKW